MRYFEGRLLPPEPSILVIVVVIVILLIWDLWAYPPLYAVQNRLQPVGPALAACEAKVEAWAGSGLQGLRARLFDFSKREAIYLVGGPSH